MEFLDQLNDCQLINDSVPWSYIRNVSYNVVARDCKDKENTGLNRKYTLQSQYE